MYADAKTVEFAGRRSETYKGALSAYPDAWLQDICCMERFLAPKPGERILEIGAGSGYFSRAIALLLGPTGRLTATDPAIDQLAALGLDQEENIEIVPQPADALALPDKDYDAVWSRGAIHHVTDKTAAFRNFAHHCRPGARLVIADIFAGTPLARYFDSFIARSSCTGHEVAFLSRDFAESLCALTGWGVPRFFEVTTPWEFAEREDIGRFLHLLFSAMDTYSTADCLAAAESLLSVGPTKSGWALFWPMTVMVATKGQPDIVGRPVPFSLVG